MDETELLARTAQALWAGDFHRGFIVTPWDELGDVAIESYVKDARAFIAAAGAFGIEIRAVS